MELQNDNHKKTENKPENEINKLRLYKGLEDVSDEEALEILGSIRKLAVIVLEFCEQSKKSA